MSKSDRILGLFPAFYRAEDSNKLLGFVVESLAQPLEEADTHLLRVQRAHRLKVAERVEDIIHLGEVLGLTRFHFEDIINDQVLRYDEKLALLRERVQRIARVHVKGLGTPWAVMEAAAIFLNAVIVAKNGSSSLITHLDADSFSHEAIIEFRHLPDKPRDRLYLHENPFRRQKVDPVERWQANSWTVLNRSAGGPAALKIIIQGVDDRTVLPGIYCSDNQEGVLFNGIVPDGRFLSLDAAEGAMLGNAPVDEWLIYYRGGAFDYSAFDKTNFVEEELERDIPFDGDVEKLTSPPFRRKAHLPFVPQGNSEWHFRVVEGVYDVGLFDCSVYACPTDPIGIFNGDFNFDQSLFAFPASAIVGMAWDERIPCAFKLLLPANPPPSKKISVESDTSINDGAQPKCPTPVQSSVQPVNNAGRIGSIMSRFKPAGIRAYIDSSKEAWILGESILRDIAAIDGEGVKSHSTVLRDDNADLFVTLENE
jgi:hypothetical protein